MSQPQLLMVITALLWSVGGLFIKIVDWNAMAIAGGRSFFAAIILWSLLPKRTFRLNRWVLAGAAAYSLTVITFVAATRWTTAANAIFLQFTAPVYVAALGGWFLGEKSSPGDWTRMAIAQLGILLFFLDGLTWGGTAGNLLALVSGVGYASLILLLRKQKDANPVDSVVLGNVATVIVCLPWMVGPLPDGKSILAIAFLGLFQLGLSYYLYTKAIKFVPALSAILIGMIEPVFNPVWVLLVLGERPTLLAIAGGMVVMGAACAQGIAGARTVAPKPLVVTSSQAPNASD